MSIPLVLIALFFVAAADRPTVKSAECMACHDGRAGPEIREHSSHAFDIDYEQTRRSAGRSLKPSSAMTPFGGTIAESLLVEGRVECTTCHYTHEEPTDARFRIRTTPSGRFAELCTSCHDMSRI